MAGCSTAPPTVFSPPYVGTWEGNDTSTAGVMGTLIITSTTVKFGNTDKVSETTACSAQYKVVNNTKNKSYLLTLSDKKCDYQHAINASHLKKINALNIYFSKNIFGRKSPFVPDTQGQDVTNINYLFVSTPAGNTDYRFTKGD